MTRNKTSFWAAVLAATVLAVCCTSEGLAKRTKQGTKDKAVAEAKNTTAPVNVKPVVTKEPKKPDFGKLAEQPKSRNADLLPSEPSPSCVP